MHSRRHSPHRLRSWAYALGLGLLLVAACRTEPPAPQFPPVSFAEEPDITFRAASRDVSEDYTPPLTPPHVEHLSPLTPTAAARQWADDRLAVTGTDGGTLRVSILQASIVEEAVPSAGGVRGVLSREMRRFTGTLRVRLSYDGGMTMPSRNTEATTTRVRVLPANVTLNERDQALYDLSVALVRDLDTIMAQQIQAHMADVTS